MASRRMIRAMQADIVNTLLTPAQTSVLGKVSRTEAKAGVKPGDFHETKVVGWDFVREGPRLEYRDGKCIVITPHGNQVQV